MRIGTILMLAGAVPERVAFRAGRSPDMTRFRLPLAALALAGLASFATGCGASGPKPISLFPASGRAEVRIDPIAPGVWRVIDTAEWVSVSLVVETQSGLILVDTPRTPAATRNVLAALELRTGKRPELLLLTHFHLDRVAGAPVLLDLGVPVMAGKETAELLERRFAADRERMLEEIERSAPSGRDEARLRAWQALRKEASEIREFRPNRIIPEQRAHLVVGGVELDFILPGPGHTRDNRIVHFPGLRLLDVGCLARDDGTLGNTEDADLEAWHDTVQSLLLLDADIVVTGHGLRTSPNVLLDTMES